MFDNNTAIFKNRYILKLETIIDAICNIAFDIGTQIEGITLTEENEIEYAKELFEDKIFDNLKVRKSDLEERDKSGKYNFGKKDFFSEISNFYNENLFFNESVISYLDNSDILIIDKSATFFYALEGNASERIIKAIKNGKLLSDIISKIKNEKIKYSLNSINLFEHVAFYSSTIKVEKDSQPILPIMDFALLNSAKVEIILEDFENYWINFKLYKKKFNVAISDTAERYLVQDKKSRKPLGLLIENHFFPYVNYDLIDYINEKDYLEYFWLLFKLSFFDNSLKAQTDNDLIGEFKRNFENKVLSQLLSNLKNNLYLDDTIGIPEEFESFFNEVAMIEKLEFLDEYEFLISQGNQNATALGVYSKEKKGTSYNLLHWLKHENNNEVTHFRGNTPKSKNNLHISTLKPEICFYFLEKYFEDLLEKVLKTNTYNYLSNIRLNVKKEVFCEVDFLIHTNKKLYYIEAKTKLSKFYIEDFLQKSSKMIEKFQPIISKDIDIEFILIGAYSDEDVKNYQYFVNTAEKQTANGYNIPRENLKTIPYFFTVPIPNIKGKEIICIAEPEYDGLTKLILEICPK